MICASVKYILAPLAILTIGNAYAYSNENTELLFRNQEQNSTFKNDKGIEVSQPDLEVRSGPMLNERIALLKRIQDAQKQGIGIKSYMSAFQGLEVLVGTNSSVEIIEKRLSSLSQALDAQMILRNATKPYQIQVLSQPPLNKKRLSLSEARNFMVSLVNADRANYKLSPVSLDTIATLAAQAHSDNMAKQNYQSHWDNLGKKPDQRYNEVGGTHNVSENLSSIYSDDDIFSITELKQLQASFMNQTPPHDGHKQQILNPVHKKLGIGLSCSKNSDGGFRLFLAQEFVDVYGEYLEIPKRIFRGKPFDLAGKLHSGVKFLQVQIEWEPGPIPMTTEQLNKTRSYDSGLNLAGTFSQKDDPDLVKVSTRRGIEHFCVRIIPQKNWKAGLYYIHVFAKLPEYREPVVVSTRVVILD